MNTQEKQLLDIFRRCDDEKKDTLLRCVAIIAALPSDPDPDPFAEVPAPDPAPVQTSIYHGNLEKTARKAVVPLRYQMTTNDFDDLHYIISQEGDVFNALCYAFDYGFVKGSRATRRGLVKAV